MNTGLCNDFSIGYNGLPSDLQEFAQATSVEVVELSGVSAMHCPGFTSIRESGQHSGMVNLRLGSKADSPANTLKA